MTDESSRTELPRMDEPDLPTMGVAAGNVRVLLRLEGLAAATASAILYAHSRASWWLFAALWLIPDLSMLGYLLSPCRAARVYNAFHTYIVPATLAVAGLLLHRTDLLPFALIWINHIGVDRMLAFGLKYPEGFGWTHLSQPGGQRAPGIQAA